MFWRCAVVSGGLGYVYLLGNYFFPHPREKTLNCFELPRFWFKSLTCLFMLTGCRCDWKHNSASQSSLAKGVHEEVTSPSHIFTNPAFILGFNKVSFACDEITDKGVGGKAIRSTELIQKHKYSYTNYTWSKFTVISYGCQQFTWLQFSSTKGEEDWNH